MTGSIGRLRKQKRRNKPRGVIMEATTSNTNKIGLLEEEAILAIRQCSKEEKFERIHQSVIRLLEDIFDDQTDMVECMKGLMAKVVPPVVEEADNVATAPLIDMMENVESIAFNPWAFNKRVCKDGSILMWSNNAAKQEKWRQVNNIEKAISKAGNQEQQLVTLHGFFSERKAARPLLKGLCNSLMSDAAAPGFDLATNVSELMKIACANHKSNDLQGFTNTILLALVATNPPSEYGPSKLVKLLGVRNSLGFRSKSNEAIQKQKEIVKNAKEKNNEPINLMQVHRKKRLSRFPPQFIEDLHKWIFNKYEQVVPSPTKKDSVNVKDLISGETIRKQKHYYINSIRELHNELIKPKAEVAFPQHVTQKVML
jgi:hypothetical protein